MFGIFLALFFAGVLILIVCLTVERREQNVIIILLLLGYFSRLLIRCFNRNLDFLSNGQTLGGGDAINYEAVAREIAALWEITGVHFVKNPEIDVGFAPLHHNLLAVIEYCNGYYSGLGAVSTSAFIACLGMFFLYKIYIIYDFKRKTSHFVILTLLFCPSFLMYTSDSFKEGTLVFFVISIFALLFHITSRNFYFVIPCIVMLFFGLFETRYYLVYLLIPPIVVFLFQKQIKKLFDFGIFFAFFCLCLLMAVFLFFLWCNFDFFSNTLIGSFVIQKWNYFIYISGALQADNIYSGGSLISLDGINPTLETFPVKILYTILSPFPWQGGSFALHLSKIEMFFWCFILYWTCRGIKGLLIQDPVRVLMLLSFIVPLILIYSWSFTNIGQIYRQRIVIFFVASILAVWGRVAAKQKAQVS